MSTVRRRQVTAGGWTAGVQSCRVQIHPVIDTLDAAADLTRDTSPRACCC